MLVLSRRKEESIIIDHRTVVTVVDIRGDTVRLGIAAPDHMDVNREEVEIALQRSGRPKVDRF